MEIITKITAEEAKKMYYESQNLMSEVITKGRKLTFYNGILAAIITWGMLLVPSATAYANGSQQSALDLLTKGYSIKPKVQNSPARGFSRGAAGRAKPLKQFPKDVINLATAWREIPNTVFEVAQKDGAMIGIVTGPIKGTTSMARNISKGVWQALNSDKDQNDSKGLIFNYKF